MMHFSRSPLSQATLALAVVAVLAADSAIVRGADDETAASDPTALVGDWKLVQIGDDKVTSEELLTLSVTKEGKVSGSTGVNRFFGGLAQEKTLFGPLGTTRRGGPPAAMKLEAAYTKALGAATRFTIEKDKLEQDNLTLLADDEALLVFERVKKGSP
jgi:heat shock protein HslJ